MNFLNVLLFTACSLLSLLKPSFLPVNSVIILPLSGLLKVGKKLKTNNLDMSTVGEIFSLHRP